MDKSLDNAPCGFLRFKDDGVVLLVNSTLRDMLGYEPGEIEGQHIGTILSRGAGVFYQTHFFPLLRLHGKAEEIYLSVRTKSGETLPVLVNAVRHQQPDEGAGAIETNDCVVLEMQQRTRYEDEILIQKKQAERANKAKDETLAALRETEQRLRERTAALHESATLFSTLVEQAPMGMYVVDSNFRLQQVNKVAGPVFSSIDPLIGRNFAEVMEIVWGPDVGGECSKIFRHTLDTGEHYVSPSFEEQRQDLGVEQAYEWEIQRVTLPDGQYGVVCYFQEVTERVRAERAVRESDERMHLATEATAVGIWEWNVPTRELRWDSQMFRIYGIPPTRDGTLSYSRWSATVLPEDLPAQDEKLQETLRRGGKGNREFRIVRESDQECRYIESVEIVRCDESGKPQWVVGTNLDVTERKRAAEAIRESEERFRTLADNIPQLSWMADGEGTVFWYNQRWIDYTGASLDKLLETGWQRWIHSDREIQVIDKWNHDRVQGCTWEDTFPLRGADGDFRWFLSRAIPIRDNDGKVQRWFGTNTDITDQRRAADDLARAKEQSEAASRAKDDFLAALSHELRTPLTPVLMTAASLETDARIGEEIRQEIGMMRRNIELEALLIDDLLDITRISRGKLTIAPTVSDIHELLGHATEILRSEHLRKNIQITFQFGAVRHHAEADPTRIQQVFWNLLKNAVKFTPDGGKITVTTCNDRDDSIVVGVQDTGIGIASGSLDGIFTPFEQGEVAGQHRYGGLGLGLAISKAIVAAHGGTITAESEGRDRGACFTVSLTTVQAPTVQEKQPAAESAPTRSLQMLIIEDHESTRRVLANAMKKCGHGVTTASTLKEAREAYHGGSFDLIISDLGLPDGSGLDLMREVQDSNPIPAIALSGFGMAEDVRRIKEAGFTAHMVKPIKVDPLQRLIAEVTRGNLSGEFISEDGWET